MKSARERAEELFVPHRFLVGTAERCKAQGQFEGFLAGFDLAIEMLRSEEARHFDFDRDNPYVGTRTRAWGEEWADWLESKREERG